MVMRPPILKPGTGPAQSPSSVAVPGGSEGRIDTLESDNSAAVIKKDYMDIATKDGSSVTKEKAVQYFDIHSDTSRKVVPMTVAA
jgi:hypothetical protein